MEDGDFFDFEKCALREFKEETGIDITFCHKKLSREKIKKGFRFNHFSNPSYGPGNSGLQNSYFFGLKKNHRFSDVFTFGRSDGSLVKDPMSLEGIDCNKEHKTTKIKSYYTKNKYDTKYISMYYLVKID